MLSQLINSSAMEIQCLFKLQLVSSTSVYNTQTYCELPEKAKCQQINKKLLGKSNTSLDEQNKNKRVKDAPKGGLRRQQ